MIESIKCYIKNNSLDCFVAHIAYLVVLLGLIFSFCKIAIQADFSSTPSALFASAFLFCVTSAFCSVALMLKYDMEEEDKIEEIEH